MENQVDVNMILAILGAKEVENQQLRQQIMALSQQLKTLQSQVQPKETKDE